jgi:hypothetical protein
MTPRTPANQPDGWARIAPSSWDRETRLDRHRPYRRIAKNPEPAFPDSACHGIDQFSQAAGVDLAGIRQEKNKLADLPDL